MPSSRWSAGTLGAGGSPWTAWGSVRWYSARPKSDETTINETCDIGVGRSLENHPKLIEYGRALNRRLLAAEEASAYCLQNTARGERVRTPMIVEGQRVPACVSAVPVPSPWRPPSAASPSAPSPPWAFAPPNMRSVLPDLRGGAAYSASQAAYDLRCLRLKGLIARVPKSHRYNRLRLGQPAGPRPPLQVAPARNRGARGVRRPESVWERRRRTGRQSSAAPLRPKAPARSDATLLQPTRRQAPCGPGEKLPLRRTSAEGGDTVPLGVENAHVCSLARPAPARHPYL